MGEGGGAGESVRNAGRGGGGDGGDGGGGGGRDEREGSRRVGSTANPPKATGTSELRSERPRRRLTDAGKRVRDGRADGGGPARSEVSTQSERRASQGKGAAIVIGRRGKQPLFVYATRCTRMMWMMVVDVKGGRSRGQIGLCCIPTERD